ncbi:unnamed protein product, partial [Rotaria sp. Silwood2]
SFNHAKEPVSKVNILTSLKTYNAFELHDLSRNIFVSVRLNINSDNYSIADSESSLNSESNYDDETMKGNEVDNDLFNLNEEDQDVTIRQNVDKIEINKMDFNGIRIFD